MCSSLVDAEFQTKANDRTASTGGNKGSGISSGGSGSANGGTGGESHGEVSWPGLEVPIAPSGGGAAPVYTPAASIWSSPSEHMSEHKPAPGVFLTASATQSAPAPQYTIQGGPAKVYYFPPSVAQGGQAPGASITPAPGVPGNTDSSPVGGGGALGSDGLLTTMDKVFNPKYVYVSFSTLYAGYKVGNEMKTIGPNYHNTMFSFRSEEMSTKCASTMAPDATPSYGPPAAINWDGLDASMAKGESSCWNLSPPAGFLKAVPPEWTQQLYWNVHFDPPQMLMKADSVAQPTMPPTNADADAIAPTPASSAAAETAVATSTGTIYSTVVPSSVAPKYATPSGVVAGTGSVYAGSSGIAAGSGVVPSGVAGGVAAGTGSPHGGSNASASGPKSPVPFTGGSNPHHGHGGQGGWRMVAVGMLVGVVTVVTLL